MAELPATRPQGTDGAIGLGDSKGESTRPGRSPVKDGTDGNSRAKPTAKRKRKEALQVPATSKKRKVNVAARSTPTNARDAVHHGAESTRGNAQLKTEDPFVLNSGERARLIERFGFRQNHGSNMTRAANPVTETSVGVLSMPADTHASPRLRVGQGGQKQQSMSSPERAEMSQFLQGGQVLQAGQISREIPPAATAGRRLALRFFDSQLERRRDDGEAEKTRLLDAISWLTDLVLDKNKAEVGAEGIVFTGEVRIILPSELPLICPPVRRGTGRKIRREGSNNPLAKGTVRDGPYHFRSSLT